MLYILKYSVILIFVSFCIFFFSPFKTVSTKSSTSSNNSNSSTTSSSNSNSNENDTMATSNMTGMQFIMNLAIEKGLRPDYIGIRKVNEDGYTLHQLHRGILSEDCILIEQDDKILGDADTMEGADIDMFSLDGPACLNDLDITLKRLKNQLNNEKLLGALMFSCGGRGPSKRSMMGESMADATHFEKEFVGLPCLGFYAGGEIGPMAKVDNKIAIQNGNVAMQGFTVVFGVFIVPIPIDTKYMKLNDSEENCKLHMINKMQKSKYQIPKNGEETKCE